jgi:hypothetical protein
MPRISVDSAKRFVAQAELPPVPRAKPSGGRAARAAPEAGVGFAFDTAKDQAAVVGSDVVSFMAGVTPERRESIVNSSLLAQLIAKKQVSDPTRTTEWYNAYFDALTNIGWVLQAKNFAEYHEESQNFEAHKAIIAVATALLGAGATALVLIETTLKALQSMNEGSPWITIFSRESQTARTARFQITLAEQDTDGQVFISLMAFALKAETTITQVLFFKARSNDVTLRHHSGRVTINTTVLDGVHDAIKKKLLGIANEYVKALPELDPRGGAAATRGRAAGRPGPSRGSASQKGRAPTGKSPRSPA